MAVKELSDEKTRAGADIMHEVEFLRRCRHPNIVNFVGACVVVSSLCLFQTFKIRVRL